MDEYPTSEELEESHQETRKGRNHRYFAGVLCYSTGGAIAWAITGETDFLIAGFSCSIIIFCFFLSHYFIDFNSRHDPHKKYRILKERRQSREKGKKTTAFVTGLMITAVSPLIVFIGIEEFDKQGLSQFLGYLLLGYVFLTIGLWSISRTRR